MYTLQVWLPCRYQARRGKLTLKRQGTGHTTHAQTNPHIPGDSPWLDIRKISLSFAFPPQKINKSALLRITTPSCLNDLLNRFAKSALTLCLLNTYTHSQAVLLRLQSKPSHRFPHLTARLHEPSLLPVNAGVDPVFLASSSSHLLVCDCLIASSTKGRQEVSALCLTTTPHPLHRPPNHSSALSIAQWLALRMPHMVKGRRSRDQHS